MTYLYLLDTNTLSDFVKHPTGQVFAKIRDVGEDRICTNVIVACELRFGAEKNNSSRLKRRIDIALSLITVLSLTPDVDRYYAEIRTDLERKGMPIGGNDLLIAAHALTLDITVVTANIREFSRIRDLKVENWLISV